jgi:hypothetical protein
VAPLLLRISPLYTGSSIVFLLPALSAPGNKTNQTVISLRVKIKGSSISRRRTKRAEQALASAQRCRTAKFEASSLVFTPVDNRVTGQAGIFALWRKTKGAYSESIGPIAMIKSNDGCCPYLLDTEAVVFIAIIG